LCPPELQHDFPARALKELRMSTNIKQLPLSRAAKNTLAITYVPIDQLKPDPRNARVHSKKQIRQIARSIESFGFSVPILVGANLNVIAGHGRVLAAKHLGLTEVPTIRLDHLTKAQRRAFMIATIASPKSPVGTTGSWRNS
jgi:hypothetical protein